MGRVERIRKTSQKIIELLKQIPEDVAIKIGVEIDLLPKPVLKLFFEIYLLHSLIKKEQEKQNADREKGGKRLHSNDEGVSQRDSA